jgi:hypothetical protein
MIIAADYPFMDILWTMVIFFFWVMWFWCLIIVLSDVFSRHDMSGWGKAAWTLFVIIIPLLGVLVYLIADGKGMAERRSHNIRQQQDAIDDHIRTVASADGPATEIANAKQLLDTGAITDAEFAQIKQRALA